MAIQIGGQFDETLQLPVVPAQLRVFLSVLRGRWIAKRAFYLGGSRQFGVEPVSQAQVFVPYFCLKRSTRPAVSSSRCLPVKNG